MVRHGAVSRGCQVCRKRKIKCDKASPACTQCLKAGWDCPQYGDVLERTFQHTASKDYEQPITSGIQDHPTSDSWPSDKSSSSVAFPGSPEVRSDSAKLSPSIIQPIRQRAVDYFLSAHFFQNCSIPRGYYEYLPILINDPNCSQRLATGLSGVALAAYAHEFQYPELLQKARKDYGLALQLVNVAISSPGEPTNHNTLASVLLLNTFNTYTGQTSQSLLPCLSHIAAATSILALNGHDLIKTRTFLPLVLQVIWSLLQTYIINRVRIPMGLINLRQYATDAVDTNNPSWRLSRIMEHVANFRADVKEGVVLDPETILKTALDLDFQLSSLVENMPSQWLYQSEYLQQRSELVFETCYHVYPDQWVALIWNCLRVSRLLLQQEIQGQLGNRLEFSDFRISQYRRISAEISQRMISEICATVPQCSGYVEVLRSNQTLSETPCQLGKVTNGIPTIPGAYLVLWSLLNAGLYTESVLQQGWIVKRIRYIGKMTGVQQAFAFINVLEGRETLLLP